MGGLKFSVRESFAKIVLNPRNEFMLTALVIGYGSIGARHVRMLDELGIAVSVVSKHLEPEGSRFPTIEKAFEGHSAGFDYVVVANETSRHMDTLAALNKLGFAGTVLVEKPLVPSYSPPFPAFQFRHLYVGYNLRFHPVLQTLARHLKNERVLSVQTYAGQYLPDWRPGTDYKTSYSAHKEQGGGVLRDLSHELDYLTWLFGPWRRVTALGGRFGDLEIDSDDAWAILFEMARCPAVSLHLNYLDRTARREIVVVGTVNTYKADLVKGSLELNGFSEVFPYDRDMTYREQHKAVIEGRRDQLCGLSEGVAIIELIGAIESSVERREWITR